LSTYFYTFYIKNIFKERKLLATLILVVEYTSGKTPSESLPSRQRLLNPQTPRRITNAAAATQKTTASTAAAAPRRLRERAEG
jgi:hypothetical protein